ncbi:AAA family ATPase [Priestia flexa]|uniref:AAA family ATPase n=1 Tax=Priestia flexa TaxID=86664 RepID=UPI001EF68C0C|nr:AAA family ATPase [Priestia flexa]
MINKIISIKNTGKFRSLTAQGTSNFNQMNIIYSENGRGKTTLSNILRSLNDQNAELIIGRKTLGAPGEQSISILCDSINYKFKGEKWDNKPKYEFEIFDSTYITQNIYSKNIIEHDQKKQLYLFTIGKQGVEKANQLDEIEAQLKIENTNKKELENSIKIGIQGVLSVNDFIKLSKKDNLEGEIKKSEKSLQSLGQESEIKNKQKLTKLSLPSFDLKKFEASLAGVTLNVITNQAEELTKQHIKEILDENGEKWLEYGVSYIENDQCPFCKQDISGVDIVTAFKTYFSSEYQKSIKFIDNLDTSFKQKFGFDTLSSLQTNLNSNLKLLSFWQNHIILDEELVLDIEGINKTWDIFTTAITEVIENKKRSPLEQIIISDEITEKCNQYQAILVNISSYNELIESINQKIEERKLSLHQLSLQNEKVTLERLKNIQLRYSNEKSELINNYNVILDSIKNLNKLKSEVRERLNQYTEEIFQKYETRINWHLERCGASFKISDYKSSFLGGKPSSNFSLSINNVPVPLGNEKSPLTTPSFRNTLSEGDKSSLAFAFFLAKLETDPDIERKILIFDDPISSMDNHRKGYTADQVIRYSNQARQVLVLTHDTYFARALWSKYADKKTLLTQLCIKRDGATDSTIGNWDIESETKSDYYQSYFTLADFLEGKTEVDPRSVARCIRPLLEGNLRIRFPAVFKSNEWLGNFIDKVRQGETESLRRMKNQLTELEDINDYSKKFHHDKNPFADTEHLDHSELLAYVKRTLNVLQGVHNVG